jgi:gluconate 2-dehydrogenase gamma chain
MNQTRTLSITFFASALLCCTQGTHIAFQCCHSRYNQHRMSVAMSDSPISRRKFLAGATASAVFTTALAEQDAQGIQGEMPWAPRRADVPRLNAVDHYQFFTAEEAAFVDAATERMIPQDELGPGANQLGVTTFIDRQLAGAYGRADRWYMQGPWAKGEDTQGFQSRMTPSQLYRSAIKMIEEHVHGDHGGKNFSQLTADQQDELLGALESGKLALQNIDGKTFFKILLQNAKEGVFADPMYGGNKDMAGWKMIGFPGARYDYTDWIDKQNTRYTLPPVGIMGRPDWHKAG